LTVVGSLAVGVFEAPPPVALAVFVTLGTAAARTFTLRVIGLPLEPAGMGVVDVHVTV
jgi:hypothetical protein